VCVVLGLGPHVAYSLHLQSRWNGSNQGRTDCLPSSPARNFPHFLPPQRQLLTNRFHIIAFDTERVVSAAAIIMQNLDLGEAEETAGGGNNTKKISKLLSSSKSNTQFWRQCECEAWEETSKKLSNFLLLLLALSGEWVEDWIFRVLVMMSFYELARGSARCTVGRSRMAAFGSCSIFSSPTKQ
jgi:hypothetical protein